MKNTIYYIIYYNLRFIFISLAISSVGYDDVVLIKMIAEVWKCGDIKINPTQAVNQTYLEEKQWLTVK